MRNSFSFLLLMVHFERAKSTVGLLNTKELSLSLIGSEDIQFPMFFSHFVSTFSKCCSKESDEEVSNEVKFYLSYI